MIQKQVTFHLQVHPSTSTTHPTIAKRHGLNEHYRRLIRKIQQSAKKVFHILHVFRDTLIVHRQLNKHQIRLRGDVEREAKRKVIGAGGWIITSAVTISKRLARILTWRSTIDLLDLYVFTSKFRQPFPELVEPNLILPHLMSFCHCRDSEAVIHVGIRGTYHYRQWQRW